MPMVTSSSSSSQEFCYFPHLVISHEMTCSSAIEAADEIHLVHDFVRFSTCLSFLITQLKAIRQKVKIWDWVYIHETNSTVSRIPSAIFSWLILYCGSSSCCDSYSPHAAQISISIWHSLDRTLLALHRDLFVGTSQKSSACDRKSLIIFLLAFSGIDFYRLFGGFGTLFL